MKTIIHISIERPNDLASIVFLVFFFNFLDLLTLCIQQTAVSDIEVRF